MLKNHKENMFTVFIEKNLYKWTHTVQTHVVHRSTVNEKC